MLLIFYVAWQLHFLFWPPRGQLHRACWVCSTPVARNDYVTKPRALNVFIHGLAEFVVDKGLINNKELI